MKGHVLFSRSGIGILFVTVLPALMPEVCGQPTTGERKEVTWYTVTRVIDGDTFLIDDGSGKEIRIRLIGVDAPEPRNRGKKLKGYFGSESSAYLKQLLDGHKVRLEYDVSRYDRYRRTLAYVYLEDGTFVNAILVEEGFATVMTVPPNVMHADEFVKLAAKARMKKKGLWKPVTSKRGS